jgi:hypothetical protein
MIDPGEDVRLEKKLGLSRHCSLLSMHTQWPLRGPKVALQSQSRSPDDASWPLCVGNLSLAVLKKNGLEK